MLLLNILSLSTPERVVKPITWCANSPPELLHTDVHSGFLANSSAFGWVNLWPAVGSNLSQWQREVLASPPPGYITTEGCVRLSQNKINSCTHARLNKAKSRASRCGCVLPTADQDRERQSDVGAGVGWWAELISLIHCLSLPFHKLCRAGWERLCEGRVVGTKERKKEKDIQRNQGLADKKLIHVSSHFYVVVLWGSSPGLFSHLFADLRRVCLSTACVFLLREQRGTYPACLFPAWRHPSRRASLGSGLWPSPSASSLPWAGLSYTPPSGSGRRRKGETGQKKKQ